MMKQDIDYFNNLIRTKAVKEDAFIIVVGGQSGSGKSHLIYNFLEIMDSRDIFYCDLQIIKNQILSSPGTAKQKLYDLFKCYYFHKEKNLSTQIIQRIQESSQTFLKYYLWLEKACRSTIMEELSQKKIEEHYWIFELVSPIDSMWEIADFYVYLTPPPWKIEKQLMYREGINRFSAMTLRIHHEKAIEINNKSRKLHYPELRLLDSGKPEAIQLYNQLKKKNENFNFRTKSIG